jgi:nucleoside-diphosphate-sugar epimerase
VELVERLAKAANTEATLARVPRDVIQQAGGNAFEEPYYFGEYLDVPPITMNTGKLTRTLKVKMTPLEAGLKETYRWYTRNHKPRATGFDFDDKLLAMAKTAATAEV